jgi:hypothetical protein
MPAKEPRRGSDGPSRGRAPVTSDDEDRVDTGPSIDVFDRPSDGETFVLTSVRDDRGTPRRLMGVAAIAVAVIALNLLPSLGILGEPPGPTAIEPTLMEGGVTTTSGPSPQSTPGSRSRPIHQFVEWAGGRLAVDVPVRFHWMTDHPLAVSTGYPPDTGLTIRFHSDVAQVRTDLCTPGTLADVGPSADDLVAALAGQVGGQREGPLDVVVGGYPARKFLLTVPPCADAAEGVRTWRNRDGSTFIPLVNGDVVIWVVDVDGDRMVITSDGRGAPTEDIVSRDALIASLRINPEDQIFSGIDPSGRLVGDIDGIGLTIGDQARDWTRQSVYLSKSTKGPQGAEAMILWTTDPGGRRTVTCSALLGDLGTSADDLGDAVAHVSGTDLIVEPRPWWIDRRRAVYVVVRVRELIDQGCQPGLFFSWDDAALGAFWPGVEPGDTISVWIVDVDDERLVIEAATKPDAGPRIDREIEEIVGSLRIESVARPNPEKSGRRTSRGGA